MENSPVLHNSKNEKNNVGADNSFVSTFQLLYKIKKKHEFKQHCLYTSQKTFFLKYLKVRKREQHQHTYY